MNGADISSQDFVSLFIFQTMYVVQLFHIFLTTDFFGYLGNLIGAGRGSTNISDCLVGSLDFNSSFLDFYQL